MLIWARSIVRPIFGDPIHVFVQAPIATVALSMPGTAATSRTVTAAAAYAGAYELGGGGAALGVRLSALSGSIFTILTGLNWICVGIHGRGALPSPVLALDWPIWC